MRKDLKQLSKDKLVKRLEKTAWTLIKTIVDTTPVPFLILDPGLRVIVANKLFYRTFQTSSKETEKQRIYNLGKGQWNIPKLRMLLEEILPKKTHFRNFEVEYSFPKIGNKVMLLSGRQIYEQRKTPRIISTPMILLVIEDITQLRNSQRDRIIAEKTVKSAEVTVRTLKEKERRNEATLSSIGDGVLVVDKTGHIIAMSEITEEMLGWKFEEIRGKNLYDTFPIIDERGNLLPKEKRPMYIALATGKSITTTIFNSTYYYIRKDGTSFPVAIAAAPIILKEKIIGAIDSFRNITKEREVDRAKTEFVSLASHQLRTPLTAIKWCSEMLLSEETGKLNPKQKKYVKELCQGNERMIELVRNLLNVSRIEMGVLAVNSKPIDIGKLIKDVIKKQIPFVQEKNHKVVVEIPRKLPKISTDYKLVQMIFQNLFGNAIEYTPAGGKITCTLKKETDEIVFEIKDTGIGIPERQQNRVFQKLFRGDNAIKEHSKGTGLELYITKAMVDALTGKIWFKSEKGKGTTFWVALPLKKSKAHPGQKIINNYHD